MAVHVPLSIEAQAEARFLMLSANNILKLSDGKPVMTPTQDMVLGAYYLTIIRRYEDKWYDENHDEVPEGTEGAEQYRAPLYTSEDEAIMAYQTKSITLQDEIYVKRTVKLPEGKFFKEDGEPETEITGRVKTTVGRIIYNEAIPQDLGFVARNTKEDYLKYEIGGSNKCDLSLLKDRYEVEVDGKMIRQEQEDEPVGKKMISKIVDRCFKTGGAPKAADVLDKIKALGYKYSTIGAITTSVFDMHIPDAKKPLIAEAEHKVEVIEKKFARGLLKDEERYNAVVNVWKDTTDAVTNELKKGLDKFNPIWMMANSGARGSIDQIKQLAGMRGLMVNPQGKMIEIPVKSCFREGLTVLEYFISSHGGRKGLADTALKTADSGYLTRRLVDVSQDVIVREDDCCAGRKPRGMRIKAIRGENGDIIESLEDRLAGRFVSEDVVDPATGEVIVATNEMITDNTAKKIVKAGIEEVSIRSIFTCNSRHGVCAKCYGKNMATDRPIQVGEAVGVIAAQSIGEPGTQLTMRTFHTGGIAATGDITQGLPRVEELFEARKPKGVATLTEVGGIVYVTEQDNQKHVVIRDEFAGTEKKEYVLPFNAELKVKTGDKVEPGKQLNGGSVNPQDILRILGVKGVQDYILEQVQSVYRSQGVDINDKHVEIIVRQMMRKVRIENCGDTDMLPGELVDMFTFEDENLKALEKGGRPATAKRVLLGITKAALSTDSFLSAASFQETARVLTEAAIKNKVDPLIGLKENVIIGKLIPAGTGVRDYKNMSPQFVAGHRESDPLVEAEELAEEAAIK